MSRLSLYIPKFEELNYEKKLLQDKDTMSYNRGYDISSIGYDKKSGCICHPQSYWISWYDKYMHSENYFFAYLFLEDEGVFVGDVNFHTSSFDQSWHDIGILIESKYRGRGFSKEGLSLLIDYAFEVRNCLILHNYFEETRTSAVKIHRDLGFKQVDTSKDFLHFILAKEDYKKEEY